MKKIERVFDCLFWFIAFILPLVVYFIMNFRQSEVVGFFDFIQGFSPFPFVQDVFDEVTTLVFGDTFAFCSYLSYLVGVEIFHVFFDCIVFIPRWFHSLIYKFGGRYEK